MAKVDIADLGALLELQTNSSQTKLRKIKDREDALHEMLAQLSLTKDVVSKRQGDVGQSTVNFQNELQHLRWIDQRRSAINIELAQIRALIDIAKQEVSKHFARQQALNEAAKRQAAAAAALKERRASYGS